MREIKAIISAYSEAENKGIKTVLATVVHVEGSSYRRPSARMLVEENGNTTGAISGGCLEGDALRKALFALEQGKNTLITYDTSDEQDAIVGAQLGCNGVIQVLFEPVDPADQKNPIKLLSQATTERGACVMVTLFDLKNKRGEQQGTSMIIKDGAIITGTVSHEKLQRQVLVDAKQVLEGQTSLFRAYVEGEAQQNVFMEYFSPPITLAIVGAGNDTQGLAQMAETLGWQIFVVDGRPTHAKKDRFVSSCQVLVSKPDRILEHITVDDHTVFVLLTLLQINLR